VTEEKIPALRPVEVLPVRHEGREVFLLRDPQGLAGEPIALSPASVSLLHFFDGGHSVRDIQLALTRATGEIVPSKQIQAFVEKLDAHFYLDSDAYHRHRQDLTREYASWSQRPARFAGQAYSDDPAALIESLNSAYDSPGGPGKPTAPIGNLPAGIVAPHIDPNRGAAVYAQAYKSLWGAAPKRIVVLGIAHSGGSQPFILTGKDYATPLGVAHTDTALIGKLAKRLAWDPLEEEDLHRWEHSIEFQILFIQHALTCAGQTPCKHEPEYLPILCAFPWQTFGDDAAAAVVRERVDDFLAALRHTLAEDRRDLLIVAGVDLAHLGRRFGDTEPLTQASLTHLESRDLATLGQLADGDRDGFVQEIIDEEDERRLCGFPALYALLTLLPDAQGNLLSYRQSVEETTGSIVSFAALVYEQE
jgi:predicted class III extradiol MEMO1 family dioxygenase